MTATPSTEIGNGLFKTAWLGHQNLHRAVHGYECVAKGLMTIAAEQVEYSRGLVEDTMDDVRDFTGARSPEAILHAQIRSLQRHARRTMIATEHMADRWNKTCAEWNQTCAEISAGLQPPAKD